jgi:hypothetical protein
MIPHASGNADAASLGQRLQPGSDVHAIAKDVAILHHDIADVDSDAKLQPVLLRERLVGGGKRVLNRNRAIERVDNAGEFRQLALAFASLCYEFDGLLSLLRR